MWEIEQGQDFHSQSWAIQGLERQYLGWALSLYIIADLAFIPTPHTPYGPSSPLEMIPELRAWRKPWTLPGVTLKQNKMKTELGYLDSYYKNNLKKNGQFKGLWNPALLRESGRYVQTMHVRRWPELDTGLETSGKIFLLWEEFSYIEGCCRK